MIADAENRGRDVQYLRRDTGKQRLFAAGHERGTGISVFGCAPLESSTADQKLHYLIFSSKILSGSNYYAPAGCALFAFSESSFYRSVFSSMQNDKEIYLATTSGQILSHSDKQLLAAQQPQPLTDWVRAELDAGQSHGSRTFRLDGEEKACRV